MRRRGIDLDFIEVPKEFKRQVDIRKAIGNYKSRIDVLDELARQLGSSVNIHVTDEKLLSRKKKRGGDSFEYPFP